MNSPDKKFIINPGTNVISLNNISRLPAIMKTYMIEPNVDKNNK